MKKKTSNLKEIIKFVNSEPPHKYLLLHLLTFFLVFVQSLSKLLSNYFET